MSQRELDTYQELVVREEHADPRVGETGELEVDCVAVKVPAEHEVACLGIHVACLERHVAALANAALICTRLEVLNHIALFVCNTFQLHFILRRRTNLCLM